MKVLKAVLAALFALAIAAPAGAQPNPQMNLRIDVKVDTAERLKELPYAVEGPVYITVIRRSGKNPKAPLAEDAPEYAAIDEVARVFAGVLKEKLENSGFQVVPDGTNGAREVRLAIVYDPDSGELAGGVGIQPPAGIKSPAPVGLVFYQRNGITGPLVELAAKGVAMKFNEKIRAGDAKKTSTN